jgi:hypothetical protein
VKKFSILFLFVVFFLALFLSFNNYAFADGFTAHPGNLQTIMLTLPLLFRGVLVG